MKAYVMYPPPIGAQVVYKGSDDPYLASAGVMTIVENDEFNMAGFVVVEDSKGNKFGRDVRNLKWAKKKNRKVWKDILNKIEESHQS